MDRTDTILMKNISSLIVDDNISVATKSDFISIVASLVDTTPLSQGEKKIGDSWRSVMVTNVLQFANDSRVREGERLCKRAVHHTMDPSSPTMLQSTLSIVIYKQKSVIILKNKVKASMISCLYDVSTCFNSKSFVIPNKWAHVIAVGTGVRYHPREKYIKNEISQQSSSVHHSKRNRHALSQKQNTNISNHKGCCCVSW